MLVSWLPPPLLFWNGNLTGHYVYYRPANAAQPFVKSIAVEFPNDASKRYTCLLTGLVKTTQYLVSVKAYNKAGTGPASQELSAETLAGELPPAPQVEGFNVLSRSRIKINWRYPASDALDLISFSIYCRRDDLGYFTAVIPVNKHSSSYVVHNLQSGVKYSFFVSAINSFGEGELSEAVTVHLHESPLGFVLLLAESNIVLASAILVSIVTLAIAILASVLYVRRAQVKHEEDVRRYQTLARTLPHRLSEKGGTLRSTATYATIPADRMDHVTMRSCESNSQASSYGYGAPCVPVDAALTSKRVSMTTKKSKDYEEIVYDDAGA